MNMIRHVLGSFFLIRYIRIECSAIDALVMKELGSRLLLAKDKHGGRQLVTMDFTYDGGDNCKARYANFLIDRLIMRRRGGNGLSTLANGCKSAGIYQ